MARRSPSSRPAWENPLVARYASEAMLRVVSDDFKYTTWRKLWVVLAEAQRALGLAISKQQIAALRRRIGDVDYRAAARYERRFRHDVMAHLNAFGDQAPRAKGILHLGATSAYVTDNADLIQAREALGLIEARLLDAMRALRDFARRHRSLPALAYTHFQPAQPTTVGKRACLWLQDLVMDFRALEHLASQTAFLGAKAATGTQASFLALFKGSHARVKALDAKVARAFGFSRVFPVAGQVYPRKWDFLLASALSGIAQSAGKFANDVRLLQGLGELDEPFEREQVGSSAMPYKRNPMRSERLTSLARFTMVLAENTAHTAAGQWLERSLDDSANRRLVLPQLFLAADAMLILVRNIVAGLVANREVIAARLREDAPFMATEGILMAVVKKGGSRQELHEKLRRHAMAARLRVRQGKPSDLLERIARDESFQLGRKEINALTHPRHLVGRAPEQVSEFLRAEVEPILRKRRKRKAQEADVSV
jgi:adenylosuccinate lyase